MTIKKQDNGKWLVDIRPQGRNGKRFRKQFDTKSEAGRYEKHILATSHNKPWLDKPADRRTLVELINQWFLIHGQQLKDGEDNKKKLLNMCERMGNPLAKNVSRKMFLEYRAERLSRVTPQTVNKEQAILSGVFTQLIEADDWHEHPIKGLKKVKEASRELGYLRGSDIDLLLSLLSGDTKIVASLCLSTGARWSEAMRLTHSQVQHDRVTFVDTKNGKNRTVPISRGMHSQIPMKTGRLFKECYKDFIDVISSSGIELQKGQKSHVLRHTFASHFVMNGGNILTLQKILGHGDIKITMGYAHLAPDHLSDAIEKNPLSMTTV